MKVRRSFGPNIIRSTKLNSECYQVNFQIKTNFDFVRNSSPIDQNQEYIYIYIYSRPKSKAFISFYGNSYIRDHKHLLSVFQPHLVQLLRERMTRSSLSERGCIVNSTSLSTLKLAAILYIFVFFSYT